MVHFNAWKKLVIVNQRGENCTNRKTFDKWRQYVIISTKERAKQEVIVQHFKEWRRHKSQSMKTRKSCEDKIISNRNFLFVRYWRQVLKNKKEAESRIAK
eukprot:UN32611